MRAAVNSLYNDEIVETAAAFGADSSTKVAIIDSVYDPGEDFRDHAEVRRMVDLLPSSVETRDFVDDETIDDTTGHGSIVLGIIDDISVNAEYYFYRVVQPVDGGQILARHLVDAIGKAHLEDGVDVIHISLGNDHTEDGNEDCISGRQPCRMRYAADMAIRDGISVVASAGNDSQYDSVCCPSLADGAISVGGFVVKCRKRLEPDDLLSLGGVETKPPQACWLVREDDAYVDEVFCTGLDCSPYDKCEEYQSITNWTGNVDRVRGKPDILGPAMFPVIWGVNRLSLGTSWAAGYVTAGLIEIIAGLRDEGVEVTPELLRRSIIEAAFSIEDSITGGYSYRGTATILADKLGLEYEYEPDSSSLFRDDVI